MGLMELPRTEPGQLLITPHPMLLDGQRSVVWEAQAGESLYALLMRNVPELDGQAWAVCIGGVPVERHLWHRVRPKAGQVIEVRGGVGKAALAIVAMVALTYFTMGAGAGWIAGTFGVAAGGLAAAAIGAGLFMAGSMLINKVLAPKPAKLANQQQDSVFSISGARNQLRPYDPLPMLFGRVRIAPDLLSKPYTWYEGNDQYLGLLLCAGINVGRIEELYNGDTLLSSYEGVQVSHAGYSQMPEQAIPLYSNADTIDGAELENTSTWVERTTSTDTVRIQINLEYVLGGLGTSGKSYFVNETVEAQYRVAGATNWMPLASQTFRSEKFDVRRATLGRDVERGQYDVRVRMLGQGNYSGKNTQKNDFQWTTLTSVQADEADYTGLSRTGVRIKATGQLNGTPDELRAVGYADPIPVWNGTSWATVESSNPGAQILAYARGIRRSGRLLGGMALADAQIDIASLQAFMLHCAANGYSYDNYIKDARNHEQVLSAIALAGFGQITWAGGRLGVVWATQEQPLSGVVNMATIKKGAFQVDYNLSNAADGIEYSYFDAATWETKTLRVPAPGVTTMLNPAQVAGEGVTTEEHAARLARWHLAQSLYQYKDISYSTDIEHLSYQRLSLLALQHDMTQWGYGGRVHAASNAVGKVTLTLDEPVPAPASGNAYIGLRIPGERVYRVLRVKPFAGESRTVELADGWPADARLPGDYSDNPAHDTLWIYDFKQTPGLRVRVTSIEPESDLKGASVRVVAEGPEFWNYVLTGAYIPPPSGSLLPTRPVASNLRITEQQVVQGNTTFTELTATFDVTGPVANVVVSAAGAAGGGILGEVAQTRTRTATWRIPRADSYTVVVRPFTEDGTAGVAVTGTYITAGADVPPVLVDLFDVQERGGGVRLYTWGWLADTMQSPDFAGVEIRYTPGAVPAPDWDTMTPMGDTGFFTAAFEAVVPDAGQWTFACRSRNSSGQLSTDMRVVLRTLGNSLSQVISETNAALVAEQQRLDQEVADRLAGDLAEAQARAAAITATTTQLQGEIIAARDAAIAHADVIGAQVADILEADEWVSTKVYPAGDLVRNPISLYRAIVENINKNPASNPDVWQYMGEYSSLGEAVAASISIGNQNTSDIAAESQRIDGIVARMPAGTDMLANEARVVSAEQASVTRDNANARATQLVSAELAYTKVDAGAKTFRQQTQPQITGVRKNLYLVSRITAARVEIQVTSGQDDPQFGNSAQKVEIVAAHAGSAGVSPGSSVQNAPAGTYYAQVQVKAGTATAVSLGILGFNGLSTWATLADSDFYLDGPGVISANRNSGIAYITGLSETEWTTIRMVRRTAVTGTMTINVYVNGTSAASQSVGKSLYVYGFQVERDGFTAYQAVRYPTDFDGSGLPVGSIWEKTNASNVVIDRLRYNGNAWESVVDTSRASAIALNDLSTSVGLIDGRVTAQAGQISALTTRVGNTESAITQEAQTRAAADAALAQRATLVEARMPVGSGVLATKDAADAAAAAAQAASDLAGGKGKVIYGSSAPATADRVPQNLWIDTTGGANTPKRWNGSAWVAVTDKVATDAAAAAAAALDAAAAVDARVTTVDNASVSRDQALGSRVELVEARMPVGDGVLATATALQALESEVGANGAAIGTLTSQVTAANTAASQAVTATEELRASVGGGGNLLSNSVMRSDADGWSVAWRSGPLRAIQPSFDHPSLMPAGIGGFYVEIQSTDGEVQYNSYVSSFIPASEGQRFIASAYVSAHRCNVYVGLQFYNAAGDSLLLEGTAPHVATTGNRSLSTWARSHLLQVAPAGTAKVRMTFWVKTVPGQSWQYGVMVRPMLELAGQYQTKPSPWSAGGLETAASHSVSLDVNGHVSGTQSINDGKRSSFSILASVFRVISNVVNAGMEWQDGYLRMWKGGAQLVMGHTFGSGDLIFWYGPNIGSAACTKGNGTIWFDTVGGAYFGGTLSAGVLKNASQTTVLTANPSINVGPFTTLGRTKVVTVGYSASGPTVRAYFPGRPSNSPPPRPTVPAPEYTTLYLYRSYGGGAEQLVTSSTIGHGVIEVAADYVDRDAFDPNLPNGGWYQDYYFISTGSMTVSDTTPGTNTFQYRAYAVSGGYPRDRQTLSVISVEQ